MAAIKISFRDILQRPILQSLIFLVAFCHASEFNVNGVNLLPGSEPMHSQKESALAFIEPKILMGRVSRTFSAPVAVNNAVNNARFSLRSMASGNSPKMNSRAPGVISTARARSCLQLPTDLGKPTESKTVTSAQAGHSDKRKSDRPTNEEAQISNAAVFDPLGISAGMSGEDIDSSALQRLLWESTKGGDLSGVMSAVNQGAKVEFCYADEGDATALQCAALFGHTDIVSKLLSLGANVNHKDRYNWTPLHDAALNGHTDVVSVLVSHGANVNARTTEDEEAAPGVGSRTPFTCASMNGHTDTVRKLAKLGADVGARQKDGWTALHLAAKNGWCETVTVLVKELGLDVNVKNDVDMTALHYAAWDATIETCQTLIGLGVDVKHKAKGKLSALDLAERRKREAGGRMVTTLLRGVVDPPSREMTEEEMIAAISENEDWEEPWNPPEDPEWRLLIKNDPYSKSSDGLDF